ncbi:hypothetical protein RMR10_011870 [Agrobacterium rosae]|uniref:hypothetical protein n=1 Tax=Agrobacterium rosae TaxID=1972867 RepID=UPI002A11FF0A|nr:hypothetical protein [Agrobacterium rosae]MDX8313325.1 hypothetical protein [Agrobacterium rosae]
MTISSEVSKAGPYFGNGSTTVFPYGFKILDEKHIEVVVMDASFVVSTLSLAGGDYTVTGVGSETGGTIVKSSPLLTGQKLNMVRRPDFTQETSLENQGPYYPEVIEGRFDVTVMQIQALKEGLDRAISVPVGEARPEIKDVFDALRESGENADSAAASALLSQRYANEPEDSAISPGLFSAFHWFRKALAQATGAAASAALALTRSNNSQTSATNSANSATASEASRQASGTSATNSANSATASEASRQASGTSATNSANSATASQASRVASETARTGSESARDTAQTHATNAGNSATSASGSAGTATTKAAESTTARDFSYKWASEAENTQVNDGVRSGYSAYHWSKKAELAAGGGVLSWGGLTGAITTAAAKSNLGITNVNDTSDANKPVSTAQQTALNFKANLASPTFTGDPKAPTPTAGDNDTSIATTAFVTTATSGKADIASPTFTGDPKAPTPAFGDNDTSIATTAFVQAAITPLASEIKAWVNFNGTGTPAIRASRNVSSITDNGVGDYRVNFTSATVDANYGVFITVGSVSAGNPARAGSVKGVEATGPSDKTTSGVAILVGNTGSGTTTDNAEINVTIVR